MTNLILTVTLFMGTNVIWKTTNAVSADWHKADCCLVRYVEKGKTNEFHAWTGGIMTVLVEQNDKRKVKP